MIATPAQAILALMLTPGAGRTAIHRIAGAARLAGIELEGLLNLPPREQAAALPSASVDVVRALEPCDERRHAEAARLLERVFDAGGQALTILDRDYPADLRRALGEAAPPALFLLGDLDVLDDFALGVVGTCDPSPRGQRVAEACAELFAHHNVPTVSGGADGVDIAAHRAALRCGGKTVVVLPRGLLTYRGPEALRAGLEEGRALLVSEFQPDSPWAAHAAVTRNATIAALARMVCVIEPKRIGGSVQTGRCAMAQGKRVLVFADADLPAPGTLLRLEGAAELLRDGRTFDANALLEQWRAAPCDLARQADLFDA